jgi:hypothetical protein
VLLVSADFNEIVPRLAVDLGALEIDFPRLVDLVGLRTNPILSLVLFKPGWFYSCCLGSASALG